MTIECWLGLLMGSDGNSTVWEGSWVSPTVVVGVLAPKTTVGEKPRRVINDDDCFYYYKKWFSTLDRGSMRSNLGIKI